MKHTEHLIDELSMDLAHAKCEIQRKENSLKITKAFLLSLQDGDVAHVDIDEFITKHIDCFHGMKPSREEIECEKDIEESTPIREKE